MASLATCDHPTWGSGVGTEHRGGGKYKRKKMKMLLPLS